MNSSVKRTPPPQKQFPKLMQNRHWDYLVLFTDRCKGVVVSGGTSLHPYHAIGVYQSGWDMDAFSDFEGTVTLSN